MDIYFIIFEEKDYWIFKKMQENKKGRYFVKTKNKISVYDNR